MWKRRHLSLKNQMAERGCRINGITGSIVKPITQTMVVVVVVMVVVVVVVIVVVVTVAEEMSVGIIQNVT